MDNLSRKRVETKTNLGTNLVCLVEKRMNIGDEIDEDDKKLEEEYRKLFPPKKRRFTFTEIRNKYRRKRDGKIKSR